MCWNLCKQIRFNLNFESFFTHEWNVRTRFWGLGSNFFDREEQKSSCEKYSKVCEMDVLKAMDKTL